MIAGMGEDQARYSVSPPEQNRLWRRRNIRLARSVEALSCLDDTVRVYVAAILNATLPEGIPER
jgi:hypothetical protein